MRPMISAASARTRKSSDSAEPIGRPIIPARRNSARKASTPAIAHTIVCRLFTGHAEQAGPVGAVGRRPDGHADGRALQEEPDARGSRSAR